MFDVPYKFHVHFQNVNRHGGKHIQRGVTGTEIIHFDLKAGFPQVIDHFDQFFTVIRISGFGDFELQRLAVEFVFLNQGVDTVFQIRIEHIDPGKVDGNRDGHAIFFPPFSDLPGSFLPDIIVHDADLSVTFEQRDKITGRDHAQFRMSPADQRFRTAELRRIALDVVFRLVKHLELPFFYRPAQIIQQALVEDLPHLHIFIVDHQMGQVIPAHQAAGSPCLVKKQDRFHTFTPGFYAHAQPDICLS